MTGQAVPAQGDEDARDDMFASGVEHARQGAGMDLAADREEGAVDDRRRPRVRIVHLDAATLEALAQGDLALANHRCRWQLSPWLAGPQEIAIWGVRARQAVEAPQDLPWITGIVWDEQAGAVVGMAGFHAAPDTEGMVEVGYAVDPAVRRRGYARAALEVLLCRAHESPDIRVVRATVAPDNLPSLALLAQYPFHEVGEQWDEEDGLEIVFELVADASALEA